MAIYPTYTFRVNLFPQASYPAFLSNQPDSNIENIIYQLKNATVYIEHVSTPLKHGDIFTLEGTAAVQVASLYLGPFPKISPSILELVE